MSTELCTCKISATHHTSSGTRNWVDGVKKRETFNGDNGEMLISRKISVSTCHSVRSVHTVTATATGILVPLPLPSQLGIQPI